MKLKLVVASMSVLGLVACPAFADNGNMMHRHHHHVAKKHQMVSHADYKAMGALPVDNCQISQTTAVLEVMSQNAGRARPTEDCNKMITFAGGVNLDAHWGNRSTNFQGENRQRLALNDAYLNVYGNVNDWSKAFASFSYGDPSDIAIPTDTIGQYSNVYTNVSDNKVTLEQGFIRFANFDQYPAFVQVGKQFQDFGRYTIHPIHRTVTQSLTESLHTSAELGFILPMGFHGDIYAFDNPLRERSATNVLASTSHTKTNYGAAIGFDAPSDQLGWGVNVGYLYNMVGVNDVQQAVSQTTAPNHAITGGSYHNRVSALAIDAMVNSGPFSLSGDYVTALTSFSSTDLVGTGTGGAKPWAGNIKAGYGFNAFGKDQNLYLAYETTGAAVNLNLPKNRWVVGVGVDMWKNANLGLEVAHDTDYTVGNNGTGNNYNTVGFRAAVMFG